MLSRILCVALFVSSFLPGVLGAAVEGALGDGQPSYVYNMATGELGIAPEGHQIGLISIQSTSGFLLRDAARFPLGMFVSGDSGSVGLIRAHSEKLYLDEGYSIGALLSAGIPKSLLLDDLTLSWGEGLTQLSRAADLVYANSAEFQMHVAHLVDVPELLRRDPPWSTGPVAVEYDPRTGGLWVRPNGEVVRLIDFKSLSAVFTGQPANLLPSPFVTDEDDRILFGQSTDIVPEGFFLGDVAEAGLSRSFVEDDLTLMFSAGFGQPLRLATLVYIVPEPPLLWAFVLAGGLRVRPPKSVSERGGD